MAKCFVGGTAREGPSKENAATYGLPEVQLRGARGGTMPVFFGGDDQNFNARIKRQLEQRSATDDRRQAERASVAVDGWH
jgi:hypothetical protein